MALPTSFQARVQEMEDNRQWLLQRLRGEKVLQEVKRLELSKQHETLAKIMQRCFVLKQKDAELSVRILAKEEEVRIVEETLAAHQAKRRTLQSDVDKLEHRQQRRLEYYEQQKVKMEAHQQRMQEDIAHIKEELKKEKEAFLELEKKKSKVQVTSSSTSSLDIEIAKEERRKRDMLAQIKTLQVQADKNCVIKVGLEQRVEHALEEIEKKKAALDNQRLNIMNLQTENQSLEHRVLEAIQLRDQRRRFRLGNHVRNKI